MSEIQESKAPCPDNAHGTPLSAPAGAGEISAGNPRATEWWALGFALGYIGAGSDPGGQADRDAACATLEALRQRFEIVGPGMGAGRLAVCAALRRAETNAEALSVGGRLHGGDERTLRQLRLAIAVGALPELERESELVELGAAAMLVLDAFERAAEHNRKLWGNACELDPEIAAAIDLLRERVAASFAPRESLIRIDSQNLNEASRG